MDAKEFCYKEKIKSLEFESSEKGKEIKRLQSNLRFSAFVITVLGGVLCIVSF